MASIAHIGCGYWGRNLARNFSEMGVLSALCDAFPEAAEKLGATLGAPARSLDDILDDPSIEGVSIATPAETHAAVAIKAFERGKHVFVEKPLAMTEADCRAMIDAAAKAGRQLMVGHLLQYHPIFRKMRDMVASGEIGALQYVYSNRMSLGKFRTEEDVLWSFAPHDLSMVLALTGAAPTKVTAQGAAIYTPGIADWTTVQMQFPGNVRGHVQVSWLHPFKEQRLVAIGDKGMLSFEDSEADWSKKLALYRHTVDTSGPVPLPNKADAEYIAVEKAEPLRQECEHFVACIAGNTTPRTDGSEGLAVLQVLKMASESLHNHMAE